MASDNGPVDKGTHKEWKKMCLISVTDLPHQRGHCHTETASLGLRPVRAAGLSLGETVGLF